MARPWCMNNPRRPCMHQTYAPLTTSSEASLMAPKLQILTRPTTLCLSLFFVLFLISSQVLAQTPSPSPSPQPPSLQMQVFPAPSPSPTPGCRGSPPLYGLQGVLVETLSGKVVAFNGMRDQRVSQPCFCGQVSHSVSCAAYIRSKSSIRYRGLDGWLAR